MKKTVRLCTLILTLLLLCLSCAAAEELFWDSSMRTPDLYTDHYYTFAGYFNLALPDEWQARELSDEDTANGLIAVFADDLENPGIKVTTSVFTPEECTDIFGGTGYDVIFDALCANREGTASVQINDVWTILYQANDGENAYVIVNMTTADGYMYQIRLDLYELTDENSAIANNIVCSLEYA